MVPNLKGRTVDVAEAIAHYSSVFNSGFMIKFTGCVVVFADDHGEFTTGIAENCSCH